MRICALTGGIKWDFRQRRQHARERLIRREPAEIISDYHPDGQLAVKRSESHAASAANATDEFQKISNPSVPSVPSVVKPEVYLWDGLALLRRGEEIFINEPHPSGGSVVASYSVKNPGVMTFYLNDLLGTTLATVTGSAIEFKPLTAFGQPLKSATPDVAGSTPPAAPSPPDPLPQSPSQPAISK